MKMTNFCNFAIKVVVKNVGEQPKVKVINNELEDLQKIVGGHNEAVHIPFGDNLWMICNDIGKLENLPLNFYDPMLRDDIVGNVIFAASNLEGDFIDMTNEQINDVKSYLELQTLWK